MKGKILISILALGASSVVLAQNNHNTVKITTSHFDGFVVGVQGSTQHLTGSVKDSASAEYELIINRYSEAPLPSTYANWSSLPSTFKSDVGDATLGLGVFAGYGKVLNSNYYVGGELYARYAKNSINSETRGEMNFLRDEGGSNNSKQLQPAKSISIADQVGTSGNIDSNLSFGGALKLGYLITPKTMVYLLAGVENSHFNVNAKHTIFDIAPPSAGTLALGDTSDNWPSDWSVNDNFSENRWAFVPGIGIETMLNDRFSLKAEYTYAAYGSFNQHHDSSINETDEFVDEHEIYTFISTTASMSSDDKMDLNRGLFTLGLAYHFNGI